MGTHTHTHTAQPITPDWIYDELMRRIEPDLMQAQIAHLDEKYKGETPDEREQRRKHYTIAFMIFDECVNELETEMREDVKIWKKRMQQAAQNESAASDASTMQTIEKQLNESDSSAA